ncbi:hypothetical protein [Chitinophaga nivalis]|uniref:Bacteriocin n=1 Tax=Chitinophaga nivalis TaxID=2991709 RepID=A0ABT3IIZ6_9BACT|nr:hypothetical protein [Chitinophaga nivalis]MCW3466371.1 hypothetical protein [Chitinophaga nivalis]MCW3483938.1 hypothetical protein [Chitinophaga nivalis]
MKQLHAKKLTRAKMKAVLGGMKAGGQCGEPCREGSCYLGGGIIGQCRRNTLGTRCYCAGASMEDPEDL